MLLQQTDINAPRGQDANHDAEGHEQSEPRPMRICFVCDEYPPGPHGGIGTAIQVLGRALSGAGHQVRVIGTYPFDYPAPDYEEDRGVLVWRLRRSPYRFGWVVDRYRIFRRIERWSRAGLIDLVEVPDWEGAAAGWPRLPVPVIVRLNGSTTYFAADLRKPLKRSAFRLERASLRRADYWCSVSKYPASITQELFALPSGPDAILYNSVDIPDYCEPVARYHNRVVFTGTLTEKKGIISLIRAWPAVLQDHSAAELHIFGKDTPTAGGQSMQEYLRSQLNDEANSSVYFHGHVSREALVEVLRTSGVAVFPSYSEAFANAPVEAMACGCPTIYSQRGSGPELIEHEENGLLVDPGRPDQIACQIARLLDNKDLAERLGVAGRKHVKENFSIQALLPQNEAFYRTSVDTFHSTSTRARR